MTRFDNGLRVVTTTLPHARSISTCLLIGVGSRYESEVESGISHFIEHLCFRGTPKRPTSVDISTAIEGVGGILNGGTDKELTIFWCKVTQAHFPLALDVLTDLLLNPIIDRDDMEKERQVIIEEIGMTKDSPSQEVHMIIDELLWPGHPLGRDVAGTKESMAAITREMVFDYLKGKYLPTNIVLTIAGNIQHQEAVAAVNQAMGNWSNAKPRPAYLGYQEQPNPRLKIERRATEQAHLCLGLPGLPLLHPKRFALDLLNVILGEGMSSRLFTEIRDKLGLAYSIHSYIDHFLDSGAITIYAGVDPEKVSFAIKAILEQLARLKEPIPESELTKAKELAKGRLVLQMEDTRNVSGWLGGQEVLTERILTIDQVVSIIDAITGDELRRVAEELLVGKELRLAVVGPVAKEEPLEDLLKI